MRESPLFCESGRVQGLALRVCGVSGFGFRVQGAGFRDQVHTLTSTTLPDLGSSLRTNSLLVWGLGFGVWGLGFGVRCSGFGV